MRGGGKKGGCQLFFPAVMGTRMRFPGYPSNREADERAGMPLRAGDKQEVSACGKVRK